MLANLVNFYYGSKAVHEVAKQTFKVDLRENIPMRIGQWQSYIIYNGLDFQSGNRSSSQTV